MYSKKYKARSGKEQYYHVIHSYELEENIGFCLACGSESYCVEPDARQYECEDCGEKKVYGLEELLLMNLLEIENEE